jgi:hypothetical protein
MHDDTSDDTIYTESAIENKIKIRFHSYKIGYTLYEKRNNNNADIKYENRLE